MSAKHSRRLALTGLVFQDTDLQIVAQTVRKDLLFGLQNMRVEKAESERRITRIADQLEISHLLEKRPALLSGGERPPSGAGGGDGNEPVSDLPG